MSDKMFLPSDSGGKDKVNVNFKNIRKKFENLSTNDNAQSGADVSIPPIAPTRKYKIATPNTKATHLDNTNYYGTNVSNSVRRNKVISVKERTKMFESSPSNTQIHDINFTHVNNSNEIKKPPRNKSNTHASLKQSNDVTVTPPTKPPRSFLHCEKKCQLNSPADMSNPSGISVIRAKNGSCKPMSNEISSCDVTDHVKISKSKNCSPVFSVCPKTDKEDSKKSNRLLSTPEILVHSSSKNTTPKSQNISGKSCGIMNYLKNISTTANNIRVKKKAGIFVDLTPTTVSPPKHYGTLKRSHSEEHIYAEPLEILKASAKKSPVPNTNAQQLHYMCTPLIKPSLPLKKSEGNKFSRQCVRTMIYDSFAPVRTVPKECQDSKVPTTDSTEADMKAIQARIIYVKSIRQVSGSSICLAPKLYEALYIINISKSQPEVSHTFPLKVPDAYKYPLLPHICFPADQLFKRVSSYQSETFYFTLLDNGEKMWGYCLRIMGWPDKESGHQPLCVKLPVAICILSSFNAPLFYKRLLIEIEKHLTLPREKCFKYIRSLQKLGVPNAGASVSIPDYTEGAENNRVVVSRPFDSHTVGFDLTRALQLLDVDVLVKAVSSLLLERKVLLLSQSVSNLYSCSQAISSLLYPFEWPHMFVPVLPACLTIECCSELPYIIGIFSNNYDSLLELLAEHELLILDIDKGLVLKSCNDEDTILPRKVQKAVISALNLAKNMTDPTEMLRDIMISEAFVHMYVEMIGHYENHFIEQNENLSFQKDGFLKNAISSSIQTFLQWFSETQMFDTFIDESTWRVNYRKICQTDIRTFFEKRIDEYKWELSHEGERFSRFIEKTRNIGGKLISKLKK